MTDPENRPEPRSGMYADLDRPPLSAADLNRALVRTGRFWREIRVVAQTASTNTDLATLAAAGAPEGLVLVAEYQAGGRGRMGRTWTCPPRAGLTFSVLLRPGAGVPAARWGWIPLLVGVAVRAAVARIGEVEAVLKWPNDLQLGPERRKAAGILAEVVGGGPEAAVIVGTGLNVTVDADELPGPAATSLRLAGAATTDRDPLLRAILRQIATDFTAWRDAGGDVTESGLAAAYLAVCDTVGQEVRVELPGTDGGSGGFYTGTAEAVDADGRLVVRSDGEVRAVAAGDVVHVRPAD